MSVVIVYHSGYGCDTGCCGHVVQMDAEERFDFDHPAYGETEREFAERMVRQEFGADHVADLDWDACEIVDD